MSRIEQLVAESRTVLAHWPTVAADGCLVQPREFASLLLVSRALLIVVEELHLRVQYLETYSVEVGYAPGRE